MTETYSKDLYDKVTAIKRSKGKFRFIDLDQIGKGACGKAYISTFATGEKVVLKELPPNKYSNNEFNALAYLRDLMIKGHVPHYYIFMYGVYTEDKLKYIILEKADICLRDYLIENAVGNREYLQLFYHLANAVHYLEKFRFNHGDLWTENVMLLFPPETEPTASDKPSSSPSSSPKWLLKLIDYDCAFCDLQGNIRSPNKGGSDNNRSHFYLGYDLNRFFDAYIYEYDYFIKESTKTKAKKARKLKIKMDEYESDSSDDEFRENHLKFTPEIISFCKALGSKDPNDAFDNAPELSGEVVMKKILHLAATLDLQVL